MSTQRFTAIDYIRGIAMLSVIAIHVGGEYTAGNPTPNIHLLALFEVATRFSIPIFFFVSAFGLFYNFSFAEPFNYKTFLQRRLKAVLIPYVVWTLFYIVFNQVVFRVGWPGPRSLAVNLLFGTAKYQLYFLVILLWFYLLMPLWVKMLRHMTPALLGMVLIFQVLFNRLSTEFLWTISLGNPILDKLIFYRLNYWVLHYVFIFLLGGYLAVHFDFFKQIMETRRQLITFFFKLSLCSLLAYYYRLILIDHYKPEMAINMSQQLSPLGISYTIAASVFFFMIFTYDKYPEKVSSFLAFCGKHSFFAYLFHPVILTFAVKFVNKMGFITTAPIIIIIYFVTAGFSLWTADIVRTIGERISVINKLTIGKTR